MTLIVGVIEKEKVYIGADSAGVSGYNVTIRKDAKVFKNGDFVIGCTSSFRMIQLLRYSFKPPKKYDDADIFEYMCTVFINEIRTCFRSGGFIEIDKNIESGGTFLVGYRDRLFTIDSDFQVAESERPYTACGCGMSFALGALDAMDPARPADERIKEALQIGVYRSGGVRPPFIIEST
jgi:ATP-dependent protease HslVU (ClpYQ) peptidase subunit